MDAGAVQDWLDRYVAAWRANDPAPIADLFSADATYRYHPYDGAEETLRGRDAIAASWLESPDDPASWDAHYEPFAVDGERAVAIGSSRYRASGDEPERTYWNCFLIRFGPDGRCVEFTEYFMLQPARG